jgi:hypothetical protein
MCLYHPQDVNINCGHAECQIIQTIKKLNKNIYKPSKRAKTHPSPNCEGGDEF